MKYYISIIPAILLFIWGMSFVVDQNVNVQVTDSINKNTNSIDKKELLKEINDLPLELIKIQASLTAMVNDVEEALVKSKVSQPLPDLDPESIEKLNQSIESMYKKAGLDFDTEEARIKEAFETASSDPESLFTK